MIDILIALCGDARDRMYSLEGAGSTLEGQVTDILDGDIVVLTGSWKHSSMTNAALVDVTVPAANVQFITERKS